MNPNEREIPFDELLDQLVDEDWPETEEEIDAALAVPVQPYTDSDASAICAQILSTEAANKEQYRPNDGSDTAAPTLFDHLDRVTVSPKIEITSITARAPKQPSPIVDLYELVAKAYGAIRNRMPVDFVVLDPTLNSWFIAECRRFGAEVSEYDLNKALMNARKTKRLSHLQRSVRSPVSAADLDDIAHASEIALRLVQEKNFLERHENIALDRILCDPQRREQFDRYASAIALRDVSALELRWAALAQRKAGRSVTIARSLTISIFEQLGKVSRLRSSMIPAEPGVYLCRSETHDVFIGTTDNLRTRIERHIEAGPCLLPESIETGATQECSIGIVPMPLSASKRQGFVSQFKCARIPALNYVGLLPYEVA